MASTASADQPATLPDNWRSISDKTVFVLDRSKYFTHVSSGHRIRGDPKSTTSDGSPAIEPFDRSLWTCAVEAVVGYSRLIWDLYSPQERCISILAATPDASDSKPTDVPSEPQLTERICSWTDKEQNLDYLLKSLAKRSHLYQTKQLDNTNDISQYPNAGSSSSAILQSLELAVTDLGQLTQSQIDQRLAKKSVQCDNSGRIIVITSFQDDKSLKDIVDRFGAILKRKNDLFKLAAEQTGSSSSGPKVSPIKFCDLVIVNTYPLTDEGACSKIRQLTETNQGSHISSYSVKSGKFISGLLNNLCLQHHNLKSTTITGIPMKEEQNASSSAQYDVEIVHCSSIHEHLTKLDPALLSGAMVEIDRNGFPCDTFKLHWCTPRTSNPDMHYCVATSRITLVDVYSRPSACLTNFLLNGKQVLLEIYKSKSNRTTTHVLASRNGELFIHSLATTQHKSGVGDPPSITENLGGKVGDYRLNDFVALMKKHMLVKDSTHTDSLTKSMNLIRRQTLYWPIAIGHTILMNIPNLLGDLVDTILKETMTQPDVEECKRCIDNLIKSEKDGAGLPSITMTDALKPSTSKSQNPKLEQLYKLLWNELEYFLRVHSTTPEHELVLEYLMDRHVPKGRAGERGSKRALISKTVTVESSPMKKQKMRSKLITDISEPGAAEAFQQTAMFFRGGMTLYQTWSSLYNLYHRSRSKLPFVGRTQPPQVVQQGAPQQVPMDT